MAEEKPPTKPPRTSLVDSGWAEPDSPSPSEAAAPAPPPPKPRLPRPGAVPRANVPPARPTLRAEPAPPARPPAPPREVAESLTDAADLLDELEAEPAPQLFPGGSPFAPTPAQAQGAPPEPAPGASGILPRFAMPSETDASSPRIVDLEAAPSAPLEPQAVIGDLPAPSAPPSGAPQRPPEAASLPLPTPALDSAVGGPPTQPLASELSAVDELVPSADLEVAAVELPPGPAAPLAAAPAVQPEPPAQETAPSPSTRPLRAADYPGAPAHLPQGSDIPSLPPAHAASAGISLGEALGEPVRVAGARAPLWALLLGPAAALLLLGGGCGALLFGGSPAPAQLQPAAVEPAGSAAQASSGATASAAASPAEAPAPSAEVAANPAQGISSAGPASERSAADAVALARGRSAQLRAEWSTFMAAVKADPAQLEDKTKRRELEEFARNRELSTDTLEAVAALGTEGALDFLYEIWIGTPKRTETTQLAEELVMSKDLRLKASPALGVALALRAHDKQQPCADLQALVVQAGKVGDTRSLHLLGRLANRRGCGSSGREDCYPCLREGDVLKKAISDVRSRL